MKQRHGYVSNSSSSSFIMKDEHSMDGKFPPGVACKAYSTDSVKHLVTTFIREYVGGYDWQNREANKSEDECWKEVFEGKVPDYFQSEYVCACVFSRLDFGGLSELLESLPDGMWVTEAYDRAWLAEFCMAYGDGIEVFDTDI